MKFQFYKIPKITYSNKGYTHKTNLDNADADFGSESRSLPRLKPSQTKQKLNPRLALKPKYGMSYESGPRHKKILR